MKTYQTLALIGAILGFLFGLLLMGMGSIVGAGTNAGAGTIILSLIGLVLAFYDSKNPKLFGIVLIVLGLLTFFTTLFGMIVGALFIISGIKLRKEPMPRRGSSKDIVIAVILVILILAFFGGTLSGMKITTEKDTTNDITSTATKENSCIEIVQYNNRTNKYGWFIVTGTLTNNCPYTEWGKVYFVLYDKSGRVIKSDFTFSDPSEIPPGEVYGFEETWTDETILRDLHSYDIHTG